MFGRYLINTERIAAIDIQSTERVKLFVDGHWFVLNDSVSAGDALKWIEEAGLGAEDDTPGAIKWMREELARRQNN